MADVDELAADAYRAYGQATGGLNHRGEPMPEWGELPAEIRAAWRATVEYLLARVAPHDVP